MKILHTSDWHIGHQLYGYDRLDEHRYFFDQLTAIAREHNPDAMLVSGDIFDVSTPSASASKLFTDYILEIHSAIPEMTIIIISGNHDSSSRIDVNRNLWKSAGIYVIGSVRKFNGKYDFSDNVIPIGEKGIVIAVPYVNRAFMAFNSDKGSQESQFFLHAAHELRKYELNDKAAILMAHLTVDGCDCKGHKFGTIGNIDAVKQDIFDSRFDYIALGHIHRSQNLTTSGRVRYCGSPLAISFDEDYQHSVSIVDVTHGQPPMVTEVPIKQMRSLVTMPDIPVDFKKALKLLGKLDNGDNSYIRLNVAQDEDLPSDCEERATAVSSGKGCRYCTIKYTRLTGIQSADYFSLKTSEFMELSPSDIAKCFFMSKELSTDTIDLYLSLLSDIENDINNRQSL